MLSDNLELFVLASAVVGMVVGLVVAAVVDVFRHSAQLPFAELVLWVFGAFAFPVAAALVWFTVGKPSVEQRLAVY